MLECQKSFEAKLVGGYYNFVGFPCKMKIFERIHNNIILYYNVYKLHIYIYICYKHKKHNDWNVICLDFSNISCVYLILQKKESRVLFHLG